MKYHERFWVKKRTVYDVFEGIFDEDGTLVNQTCMCTDRTEQEAICSIEQRKKELLRMRL